MECFCKGGSIGLYTKIIDILKCPPPHFDHKLHSNVEDCTVIWTIRQLFIRLFKQASLWQNLSIYYNKRFTFITIVIGHFYSNRLLYYTIMFNTLSSNVETLKKRLLILIVWSVYCSPSYSIVVDSPILSCRVN